MCFEHAILQVARHEGIDLANFFEEIETLAAHGPRRLRMAAVDRASFEIIGGCRGRPGRNGEYARFPLAEERPHRLLDIASRGVGQPDRHVDGNRPDRKRQHIGEGRAQAIFGGLSRTMPQDGDPPASTAVDAGNEPRLNHR